MKLNWFVRKGIFFLPASVPGWFILVAAVAYAVYLFIDIDSRSHSVSDTMINWVFNCLIVAVLYSTLGWIGERREG